MLEEQVFFSFSVFLLSDLIIHAFLTSTFCRKDRHCTSTDHTSVCETRDMTSEPTRTSRARGTSAGDKHETGGGSSEHCSVLQARRPPSQRAQENRSKGCSRHKQEHVGTAQVTEEAKQTVEPRRMEAAGRRSSRPKRTREGG